MLPGVINGKSSGRRMILLVMATLLSAFEDALFHPFTSQPRELFAGNPRARPLFFFALAVLRLKDFIKSLSRFKKGKSWREGIIKLFPPFYLQTLLSLLKLLLTCCLIPWQSRCEEGRYITVQHAQQGCQLSINLWTVCRSTGVLWKFLFFQEKTGKLSCILAKKKIHIKLHFENILVYFHLEKKPTKHNTDVAGSDHFCTELFHVPLVLEWVTELLMFKSNWQMNSAGYWILCNRTWMRFSYPLK